MKRLRANIRRIHYDLLYFRQNWPGLDAEKELFLNLKDSINEMGTLIVKKEWLIENEMSTLKILLKSTNEHDWKLGMDIVNALIEKHKKDET